MLYFKLKVKDEGLLEENKQLKEEFEQLKEITMGWFAEKQVLHDKISSLENRIRSITEDNSSRIVELEAELLTVKRDCEKRVEEAEKDRKMFKFEMGKELSINETLNKRQ